MRIKIVPDDKTQETLRPVSPASRNTKRLQIRHMLLLLGARFFLLILLLVVWQFSSTHIDPIFLSSPLAIWQQTMAWISDGSLWFHTAITLQEALLGLIFGVIAGILVGFLFGMAPWLAELLDPLVIGLYSIPKVALAPLFILWFGIDIQMKIIFTAITVFFLVFLNTHAGVRNVDPDLINAVLLMGGKRRAILLKVIVPSSIGHILTGLRTAIPYALIGAVIAELIASNRGLGYLIENAATEFNTAGVFSALLVLTMIAFLLNAIVSIIDRNSTEKC